MLWWWLGGSPPDVNCCHCPARRATGERVLGGASRRRRTRGRGVTAETSGAWPRSWHRFAGRGGPSCRVLVGCQVCAVLPPAHRRRGPGRTGLAGRTVRVLWPAGYAARGSLMPFSRRRAGRTTVGRTAPSARGPVSSIHCQGGPDSTYRVTRFTWQAGPSQSTTSAVDNSVTAWDAALLHEASSTDEGIHSCPRF